MVKARVTPRVPTAWRLKVKLSGPPTPKGLRRGGASVPTRRHQVRQVPSLWSGCVTPMIGAFQAQISQKTMERGSSAASPSMWTPPLHVVEFEIELSYDALPLEDWVVDVRENLAAQPGWIHQAPDRWPCEAVFGCSLCSRIPARGAHERYVAAARVRAGSLESSEPFEVSADGQRSRVDPHGTMLVDENGVTLRGWIDSEDLKLWGPDARVQLAVGNRQG